MANLVLLTSQKNQVLRLVKDSGLDPFNFEWSEILSERSIVPELFSGDTVSMIEYKDSDFCYVFDFKNGKHYAEFSPGKETQTEHQFPGNWDLQIAYVEKWLNYLNREISEPDLWASLANSRLDCTLNIDPQEDNKPFTFTEVNQITTGVNEMRQYLESEFSDVKNANEIIGNKLDYLVDAAKRQGRKDWLHTCIGVLASLGTALGLTNEHGTRLFQILKSAVTGIVRLLN